MDALREYLCAVVPPVLDVAPDALAAAVDGEAGAAAMQRYVQEAQLFVLLVTCPDNTKGPATEVSLSVDIPPLSGKERSLALVKKKAGALTGGTAPIRTAVRVVALGADAPSTSMHGVVRHLFQPVFTAYSEGDAAARKKRDVPVAKKKMSEFEFALKKCQDVTSVDLVTLSVHPLVRERAEAKGAKLDVDDFETEMKDKEFVDAVNKQATTWISQMKALSKTKRDASKGSAMEEVQFWLNFHQALENITEQLSTKAFKVTLQILKDCSRVNAAVRAEQENIALNKTRETVSNYAIVMDQFPMTELESAVALSSVPDALSKIFTHIERFKNTKYPVTRVYRLLEGLSRSEFTDAMIRCIEAQQWMQMPPVQFKDTYTRLIGPCFDHWRTLTKTLVDVANDVLKKRRTEKMTDAEKEMTFAHEALERRLKAVYDFRVQFEVLNQAIGALQEKGDGDDQESASLRGDMAHAYDTVCACNIFDTSDGGDAEWDGALSTFNALVGQLDSKVVDLIVSALSAARTPNDMFRVLEQYQALFFRPSIRAKILEFKQLLVDKVEEDVQSLTHKIKKPTQACTMLAARGLAPVSATILWARQIVSKMDENMRRLDLVLGADWAGDLAGQRLTNHVAQIRDRLRVDAFFQEWVRWVQALDFSKLGPVLLVQEDGADGALYLEVNVSQSAFELPHECNLLASMGFTLPDDVLAKADEMKALQPFAAALLEAVRVYGQMSGSTHEGLQPMVDAKHKAVQDILAAGITTQWGVGEYKAFMTRLADAIMEYQHALGELQEIDAHVAQLLTEMEMCPLDRLAFRDLIDALQEVVDDIDTERFHHIAHYVRWINTRLETVLVGRMKEATSSWTDELKKASQLTRLGGAGRRTLSRRMMKVRGSALSIHDDGGGGMGGGGGSSLMIGRGRAGSGSGLHLPGRGRAGSGAGMLPAIAEGGRARGASSAALRGLDSLGASMATGLVAGTPTSSVGGLDAAASVALEPVAMRIAVRNKRVVCNPPAPLARSELIAQMHEYLGMVLNLAPLTCAEDDEMVRSFGATKLWQHMSQQVLMDAYQQVEVVMGGLEKLADSWLQYTVLWNVDLDDLSRTLGDDMEAWRHMLLGMQRMRSGVDTDKGDRLFGPIVVNIRDVQDKVVHKLDQLQRDALKAFALRLGARMRGFHGELAGARDTLEAFDLHTADISVLLETIGQMQSMSESYDAWAATVRTLGAGDGFLHTSHFRFPKDWMAFGVVQGEWDAFAEVYARRSDAIASMKDVIRDKVLSEAQKVEGKVEALKEEWDTNKPGVKETDAAAALESIEAFEGLLMPLIDRYDFLCAAADTLDCDVNLSYVDMLVDWSEELADMKDTWTRLDTIMEELDELLDTPWTEVPARRIRPMVREVLQDIKDLPEHVRETEIAARVLRQVQRYYDNSAIAVDLRGAGLKDRHWREIMKQLKVKWKLADLLLGTVLKSDLATHERFLRGLFTRAQGEMALEQFLSQVADTWSEYEVALVNYQNKCRLIKGWDDMFTLLNEHLDGLGSMKLSPYFKPFAEQAGQWEHKLQAVHGLFDVWMDVQREWVNLENIFARSADIKQQLPSEYSRFQNINREFLHLMSTVYKNPLVDDIVHIDGIQQQLDRMYGLLQKVQKSLSAYLEKQRAAFPRFYFVGDEDLLEIIGNSADPQAVVKHLKKMFAGIAALRIRDNDSAPVVEGMMSKEGEVVPFDTPVVIDKAAGIIPWLTAVQTQMKASLNTLHAAANTELAALSKWGTAWGDGAALFAWMDKYPAQVVLLAYQVVGTHLVEEALRGGGGVRLDGALASTVAVLKLLADHVLTDLSPIVRKKCEFFIMESVHLRDAIRRLQREGVARVDAFGWLFFARTYWNDAAAQPLERCEIRVGKATFFYGYEYLGVGDRLVQTPLTDQMFLAMTQALDQRLGGAPYGPAGTGKTESVKHLGSLLGRYTLVFCCDENFDVHSMGRIFMGLCQVGAWGCFDEFNRLDERMLSAVSQQIQVIQRGLMRAMPDIDLDGKVVPLNGDMAIFVTMNPGYVGRSNLPDNLKQLFRQFAMIRPDSELIAQVMLYSQGFRSAEALANKVVPLFALCKDQLSKQAIYDWGLRALKAVLVSAGLLKRQQVAEAGGGDAAGGGGDDETRERDLLINSFSRMVIPKLVAPDVPLLRSLLTDVFPDASVSPPALAKLRAAIAAEAERTHLVCAEQWVDKLIQLYQVQALQHGVMMVGPSGAGKTAAWRVLAAAVSAVTGVETRTYVIDPKAISKDDLYGTLDPVTLEWTDGLFTGLLRRIIDNARGEMSKRHWFVFDGDVDAVWIENLNSVLDDNKLLTLPNGERLSLPPNVRLLFEVQNLAYASPATVSRCGMVWFSADVVSLPMLLEQHLCVLRSVPVRREAEDGEIVAVDRATARKLASTATAAAGTPTGGSSSAAADLTDVMTLQRAVADVLAPYFVDGGLVCRAAEWVETREHVMEYSRLEHVVATLSLVNKSIAHIMRYNQMHPGFPFPADRLTTYMPRRLLFALIWGFSGSMELAVREEFCVELQRWATDIPCPAAASADTPLIDYEVDVESGEWVLWRNQVPTVDCTSEQVVSSDVVIPTIDTLRHAEVLDSFLQEHRPLLLCGPPGSGKTMSLTATLRNMPNYEVVMLNFSSGTSPELLLSKIVQSCEYQKSSTGVILKPSQPRKWLVVFCDEINLPAADEYGTQRVLTFMRQLLEQGGFWRAEDLTWVTLQRIQFVGACNPPTFPGRVALSHRFLRHAPLLLVDYPGHESLTQIYGTFNRGLLKLVPELRAHGDALTGAMVDFFEQSKDRFTQDMQPQYVYSPRELSRWLRAMYEGITSVGALTLPQLVRLWAHEGLRLFQDRLVTDDERTWTNERLDEVQRRYFPGQDAAMARPMLYTTWLDGVYESIEQERLRAFVRDKARIFEEDELNVSLVIHNQVLEHLLRIDRVLKQPIGHMLLIGVSGSGRTVLSKMAAWMNEMDVFQIKVHAKYTIADFEDDLRGVVKRAGCKGERIVFIFDEGNVMNSAFLESMNALLASGEVPGLFEGDDWRALMRDVQDAAARDGVMVDTEDEMYKWFVKQVQRNLHIVFTMNPPREGEGAAAVTTSPALFNRCVVDWFGDWSHEVLFQVGYEYINHVEEVNLDDPTYAPPVALHVPGSGDVTLPADFGFRDAIVTTLVNIHESCRDVSRSLMKRGGRLSSNTITPKHYLDMIQHVVDLVIEKHAELEENRGHLGRGVEKIAETEETVSIMQEQLQLTEAELEVKSVEANAKLAEILEAEKETVQMKEDAERTAGEVAVRQGVAEEAAVRVRESLKEGEAALKEAQRSVSSIDKKDLNEIKSLPRPPPGVRLAMEAVACVLGKGRPEWDAIKKMMAKADFIPNVINFDPDSLGRNKKLRSEITKQFIKNPDFDEKKIYRASKACGPLVKWVHAQIKYSTLLHSIQPDRDKLAGLESEVKEFKDKLDELQDVVLPRLEAKQKALKDDYARMISAIEMTRKEMESVRAKLARAVAILDSLASERDRWTKQIEGFAENFSTVVGDVLLASSFLVYIGYFDESYRRALLRRWRSFVANIGIATKRDLSLVEYLSNPSERLRWKALSLPTDNLCIENAIILQRFNRFPLLVDPAGQGTEFLMNAFKDEHIKKTSFLEPTFTKDLETSIRFGRPLLVQDVENFDAIANTVLNMDVHKTGGRTIVHLANKEIDFSPSFTMFLTTRDPAIQLRPDMCSRVTVVNFTVTPGSLQSQCLSQLLKSERPDVEERRTNVLRLQGEFKATMRELEQELLHALSNAQGNILEDNVVMNTLEVVKAEAAEIDRRMADSESVMDEVRVVSAVYEPLAAAAAEVYQVVEQLSDVHALYAFSLDFFNAVFARVLATPKLDGVEGVDARLGVLRLELFVQFYRSISVSLKHEHLVTLAVRLAQVYARDALPMADVEYMVKGVLRVPAAKRNKVNAADVPASLFTELQEHQLCELMQLPGFEGMLKSLRNHGEWRTFLDAVSAEAHLPSGWNGDAAGTAAGELRHLLLCKAVRPDRVLAQAHRFLDAVFGAGFAHLQPLAKEMPRLVDDVASPLSPLFLLAAPGNDPTQVVETLVRERNKPFRSLAMGSPEAYEAADKMVAQAAKGGSWVMLKNVHLALAWLVRLEKNLQSMTPHANFRLFLSAEFHPRLPTNLVRRATVAVFEPAVGLRAALTKSIVSMPADRLTRAPAARGKLYFLVAWFNAVVNDRLRYAPVGWSKMYEFNDSDQRYALDLVDIWLDHFGGKEVPWDAIRTLLSIAVYGGKVDSSFDQRTLDSFIGAFFTADKLADGAPLLYESEDKSVRFHAPRAYTPDALLAWVAELPSTQTPSWLGLPDNAERMLLIGQGEASVTNLRKLQTVDEDRLLDSEEGASAVGRPPWMMKLLDETEQCIAQLPKALPSELPGDAASVHDPLWRALSREVQLGAGLLAQIRSELGEVMGVCMGDLKPTNYISKLMKELSKGLIPREWRRYATPDIPFSEWLTDFAHRIEQLHTLVAQGNFVAGKSVWLGGLFSPSAFVTATQQLVARKHKWPLERLRPVLRIGAAPASESDFVLEGLTLEGAGWSGSMLSVTSEISHVVPRAVLTWKLPDSAAESKSSEGVSIPLYLNGTRQQLLVSVNLPSKHSDATWFRRATSLTAWSKKVAKLDDDASGAGAGAGTAAAGRARSASQRLRERDAKNRVDVPVAAERLFPTVLKSEERPSPQRRGTILNVTPRRQSMAVASMADSPARRRLTVAASSAPAAVQRMAAAPAASTSKSASPAVRRLDMAPKAPSPLKAPPKPKPKPAAPVAAAAAPAAVVVPKPAAAASTGKGPAKPAPAPAKVRSVVPAPLPKKKSAASPRSSKAAEDSPKSPRRSRARTVAVVVEDSPKEEKEKKKKSHHVRRRSDAGALEEKKEKKERRKSKDEKKSKEEKKGHTRRKSMSKSAAEAAALTSAASSPSKRVSSKTAGTPPTGKAKSRLLKSTGKTPSQEELLEKKKELQRRAKARAKERVREKMGKK